MSRKGFKIRWTCEWEKKKTSNIRENRVCLVLSVGSSNKVFSIADAALQSALEGGK